ncbi:MAG: hypothetical protein L6Q77_04215 [Bacteroidetes bacterium]|nr:hypothetical protein [Bacteroidota bacterium]
MKKNPLAFLVLLVSAVTLSAQTKPETKPELSAIPLPADTLSPQIEKGILSAEQKFVAINNQIGKSPAPVVTQVPDSASADSLKKIEPVVPVNVYKLISDTDSLLYELRLKVELLDPKSPKTQASKKKIKDMQQTSRILLVKASASHLKYAEKLDLAEQNLTNALNILENKTVTTESAPVQETSTENGTAGTVTDSSEFAGQKSSSVDIRGNMLKARQLVIDADSSLSFVTTGLTGLDPKQKETVYLSDRHHKLKNISRDLNNLTASAGMQNTVASRRLIDPNAEWDFDAKTPITTDPRVNPVKAYLEKNLADNGNIYKTISKDSLVFTFRIPDAWRKNEKFKKPVISYTSPDGKIIVTMNQSSAAVDSVHYWASIYEASSYGKNQLSGQYTRYPKSRTQAIGANQSYSAKYHFGSKEIAAVFLQKNNEVISAFIEYPNGSLNDGETGIINLILNSVKFREIK